LKEIKGLCGIDDMSITPMNLQNSSQIGSTQTTRKNW